MTDVEAALAAAPQGVFTAADVADLPPIVRRYFESSIAPDTDLVPAVRIRMRGQIKLQRWLPFTASEVLNPLRGFMWRIRVRHGLVTGVDQYLDGVGAMRMRLFGLLPILTASGPDVTRSAAARAAAESLWVPAAALPRFGARWQATAPTAANVRLQVDETALSIDYDFEDNGRIRATVFDRWGDPDRTGTWGWHRCGGEVHDHATFGEVTIPASGTLGWHYGTERWPEGEFFRYELLHVEPATAH